MSDNNTHKTSGAGSTGSVQDVIYITDDDDDQYQGAPGPVQAGQGAAGSAGESSSGPVQAGQGAAGSAGESSSRPVQPGQGAAGSAGESSMRPVQPGQSAPEANEESEPHEFLIYSGISNFPRSLQNSAMELMNDVNDWGKDICKVIIKRNRRRARYCHGSMIDGCCWKFNASESEILQIYTGELRFDGAEPIEEEKNGSKKRMREQGILTQAQCDNENSNESCYLMNLPNMARLKADDGHLYDVRLSVCASHEHKNSETPKGKGLLILCGGLINHRCRDWNCSFVVLDLETLRREEEEFKHDIQDDIVTESIYIQDQDQGTPSTPTDSEKDEDGASAKSNDSDLDGENKINLFEALKKNDMCQYFLGDEVKDHLENYLPSMVTFIMAIKDFNEEATINYGFTTESRSKAQNAKYDENAFWMPIKKIEKLFREKCEQDVGFETNNEIIKCLCFKKECEENIELDNITEKFDDETLKEAKAQSVLRLNQRYDCPAAVARIGRKETEEERNDRVRNEAYLLEYTVHNDRKNAEFDRQTVDFLLRTDDDHTLEGPLLGHWGFPSEHREKLDSVIREVNENVTPVMNLITKVHGYHGVGRHENYIDHRMPFNGDKAINEGLMLTVTVGVLIPKTYIPEECIPHSFDIGWILGFDSVILLLGCDHGSGTSTGKSTWISAAAFPHSCEPNIKILEKDVMHTTLSEYFDGEILECFNAPVKALGDMPTMNLFRVGIALGKIPEHAALSISKLEFSKIMNPIYNGYQIRVMEKRGQIKGGVQVCGCLCIYPEKCPRNNFELICECLNRGMARSRHIIRKDYLEATVENQQRKLNISKEGFKISEFELSSEDLQLKSKLMLLKDNGEPAYTAGKNSIYSPNHLSYKEKPVDTSRIIKGRETIRLDYVDPKERMSRPQATHNGKRRIIPTVQTNPNQDESKADPDSEDTNILAASAVSGAGGSAFDSINSSVALSTPNSKKHTRTEEISPPEAPDRKMVAVPRPATPPRSAPTTEDIVDLISSPEDADPVETIDGAGPAAAASAAQCYDTESDSDIEKPDEDSALPTASVPTNDSRPVPSTGVKSRAKRASFGKTKKNLVDEHVAKAVEIEKANSVDFDKFRVVFARVNVEKLAVDAEMDAIVAVSGHEAERRRTFLRVRIQELSESLTTLNGLKEQFEQKHLNVSAYLRSKNDLKKLEAPVIQKLINELDMYRFSPHYPGDGRPDEADGGSGGFGGV